MLNFYEVFELLMEAEERPARVNRSPDPNESLPIRQRKEKFRDGQYARQRNFKDGPPADMPKDRGYARDNERPEEVPYVGDHRSTLSRQNSPASAAALKIDNVLHKLAGRSYADALDLADKVSALVQLPQQQVLAGLEELRKNAPHLFSIDKASGQVTVNRLGNPGDQEHIAGQRYTNQMTKAGPMKAASGPSPEQTAKAQEINSLVQQMKAQEGLHNDDNVGKLARQIAQHLMGIIQDPSARYNRDFKEKAAVMLSKVKMNYLEPLGLHIT